MQEDAQYLLAAQPAIPLRSRAGFPNHFPIGPVGIYAGFAPESGHFAWGNFPDHSPRHPHIVPL